MSSSRRPWYPWNPKEFNNDEKVKCLTPLAELIYRRLLDVMWENNDIRMPNAIDLLYDCCGKGITKDEFAIAWARIQYPNFELFKVSEDKKWITSRRLASEAAKIADKSKSRKTAGKKGAEKRWKAKLKQKDGKGIAKEWQLPTDPEPDPDIALSKDKAEAVPPSPSSPPPKLPLPGSKTSKHYSSKIPNCSEINTACREIQELGGKNGAGFNPFSFVQEAVNKTQHPAAILEALLGIIKGWNDIRSPYAWGQAILKTKSQNYNEAEHRKQTETFRKEWVEFLKHAFA